MTVAVGKHHPEGTRGDDPPSAPRGHPGPQGSAPSGEAVSPSLTSAALAALTAVRDPELDEPVTALGFVASCAVSRAGRAVVRLRLPTYFCAPNFAFLMVADAYDAVTGVPGVTSAEVVLEDHFASDAINAGVAAQAGFVRSFDGEAIAELGDLRAQFLRKAVMAGTDLVCRPLVAAGATPAELLVLTLGDVPSSPELARLRQRRAELGLPAGEDAPLLIDPQTGERIGEAAVPLHLRKARVTRAGIEANTSICSGMFRVRYPAGWTA
jgi:metal-sulfur cluster biosynthetic enzyme